MCIKSNGCIYIPFAERASQMRILVSKDKFRVIEVNFKRKTFFFIKKIADAIIVLWYRKRFLEQAFVPSSVIMPFDAFKSVIIA